LDEKFALFAAVETAVVVLENVGKLVVFLGFDWVAFVAYERKRFL